jgi:hypothetical protein
MNILLVSFFATANKNVGVCSCDRFVNKRLKLSRLFREKHQITDLLSL